MIALERARVVAPAFPETATWLNTEVPPTLAGLAGRVVLLDFWTHCCVNCIHVLPVLKEVEEHFAGRPLDVIGVHAAKFPSEAERHNVQNALERHVIEHPVLIDAGHVVWDAYTVRAWPTLVAVDARGRVAFHHRGEPERDELVEVLERLVAEAEAQAPRGAASPGTASRRPVARTDPRRLSFPGKVSVDGDWLYVADTNHHQIHVVELEEADDGWPRAHRRDTAGAGYAGAEDGTFETATFRHPQGLSAEGRVVVVADAGNHLLRALDLDGRSVETLAGTGRRGTGESDPGAPLDVALRSPWDVIFAGPALLVAMAGSHQIWAWAEGGDVFGPVVGTGAEGHVDGPFEEACLAQPSGLHLAGRILLVADSETSSVRAVDLVDRDVSTVVGRGLFDFGDDDGRLEAALLQHPLDVASIGNVVYVADSYNNKIRAIDLESQQVTTPFGDGRPELFDEPAGIDVWRARFLLVADTNNHRILVLDTESREVRPLDWIASS